MDVVIRVEGGHHWGLGHLYRQQAVAATLRARGVSVGFVTAADGEAARMLAAEGWAVTPSSGARLLPPELSPQVLVVDMLAQGQLLRRYRKDHPAVRLVTIDDTGAGLAVADRVVNPLVAAWGAYDRNQVRAALYEGPAYAPIQSAVTAAITPKRRVARHARRVLLAFGGSDDHQIAPRMLDVLRHDARPLELRVHRGPATRYGARLEEAMAAHPHRVTTTGEDFVTEMRAADLVLCAGGSMLYELAALGAVTAATAGEAHEAANIAFFAEAGTTIDLGSHRDLGLSCLPKLRGVIEDADLRQAMASAGQALVDGRGLDRVVGVIEELMS